MGGAVEGGVQSDRGALTVAGGESEENVTDPGRSEADSDSEV